MAEFCFILSGIFAFIALFLIYLNIREHSVPDPQIYKEYHWNHRDYKDVCKNCKFFSSNSIVCNKNNYGRCSFSVLSRAVNGSNKPCKYFQK